MTIATNEPAVIDEPFEIVELRRLNAEISDVHQQLENTGPLVIGRPTDEQQQLQQRLFRLCRELSIVKNPALENVLR